MRQKKPDGWVAIRSVLAYGLLSLSLVAATAWALSAVNGKFIDSRQTRLIERLRANCADSPDALVERFRLAQAQFIQIVPPDPTRPLTQFCGLMAFEPKAFPDDFLKGLVYDVENGIPFYTLTMEEDPRTREIRILNCYETPIFTLKPAPNYDFRWLVRLFRPDTYDAKYTTAYRARVETAFDPSRVRIRLKLLPTDYIDVYAENTIASLMDALESLAQAAPGGEMMFMRSPLATSNIVFDAISKVSTGIELQISYPDGFTNRLEIYSSSNLLHTIWSLLKTNLLTAGTNTLTWVDVSATNISVSNRFYAAGNAAIDTDADGLADAREQFIYHTTATNRDSDSDGLVDGYSGIVSTNTYPGGAHTNGGAYVEGELTWHTLPKVTDTDDDGMGDGWEVSNGHNPTNWNDPPNVRGTVSYAGRQTGTVWVLAVTTSNSWATNISYSASSSAYPYPQTAYRFSHLESTNYWLKAWLDSNASDTTNATEARGTFTNTAVVITNRVLGADFELSDPDDNTNSLPDWWEVKYSGSTTNWTGSGDPDGDQYTNLEEYQANTDPTNSASHPWNISGTITYTGPQTGVIHIVACTASNSWVPVQYTTNTAPGSYTITHLPPNASYWVKAWRDSNGDNSNTFWEAWGAYASSSVTLSTNTTGVDITLADPDTDGDALPDWWEVRYGLDPYRGGADNAAAWWTLDASSGTNVIDSTINTNHGTLYNASNAWTSGIISNGLLLDGTNDYVEVPDSVTLKPSVGVSVSLWLKPTRTYTNGTAYFLSKRTPGGSTGYSLGYENGALAFTICATGEKTLRYTCALTSAVPLYVAGTFSSSGHRLYINGALSAETNYDWETGFATLNQGTNALRLGAASGSTPTNFFAGLLDDVRVFGADINSNEVHDVYELGADPDQDGLSNLDEYRFGSCPTNSDSDADGMLDSWEVNSGLNPLYAADATEDKDGDGYLNVYEAKWATDPNSTNSYPSPTFIVTNGVSTIQGAITSATQDYAIIKLLPVTYTGTNNVNVDFLGKRLMVTGLGTNTIIDGQNLTLTRGFLFRTGEGRATVLHNLLIRKMEATFGPLSTSGGGLWCSNASPTIYNCSFNQCNAYGGGGLAFVANSSPMVRACRLWGNVGPYEGAAIMVMGGEAQFRDCKITGNGTNVVGSYHTTLGGGVYISGGNPTFSNCTLSANNATLGGGAYWYSEAGSWLGGLVISNNTQGPFDTAGGMLLSGDITVSNTLVAFNSVNGAGIYSDQDTGVGGGLACYGNVRVFDSVVSSNSISRGRGAGVYLVSGTNSHPVIQGCSISGNSITTRGSGGGVAMSSSPWPGHPALASAIRGCSVVGNRTASDGGGLSADSLSVGAVESSYIGLNLSTNGLGGGVYSEGNIILQNCTVVSNQAGAGGGLYVGSGTNLTVRNTIVWNNTTNQISMTNGGSVALSYSCVKGGFAGGTAVITNNPRLFAGYRLFNQDSPCVDAGTTNGLPETDLSGKPRLSGNAPDIGCDEFVMIDTDSDGMFDDWEDWFFEALSRDGTGDYDGDRVTDGQEYAQCTDPTSNVDTDRDSLSDHYETYIGTDPGYWDSDGDGMSDGWEHEYGLDPLSPDDPNLDSDNDGWTDGQEADQNTDPFDWDTDGDGVPDSVDADPLDPANSNEATPENSCYVTLMVGDSSGSHTELYGMQLDSYRLFMSYVNSSEFIFTKTIRLPRGHTYDGYVEALGDSDNDGDYDADVTSEEPGVSIIDRSGYLGGHHEDTGFNSGRRYFQVAMQSTAANTNVASSPDPENGSTIDPINTQNGNVTLSETDVDVPCPGVSLVFGRYYNSRAAVTNGVPGPCWSHSYDILLQSMSNTQYKGTSGNWRRLALPDGQELWFQDNGDGTFQNPPDNNLHLASTQNGWLVTQPGGTQWTFDTNGVLSSVADSFSNRVRLTYSGGFPNHKLSRVEHTNGQYLAFSYVGLSLTNIATPSASFSIQFGYNSSNELARAIKNVGGTCYTNRYLYDAGTHSLTQRVNAAGDQFNYGYEYTTNLLGRTISRGISMALAPNYFQHAVNYTNAGDNATEVTYSRNGTAQTYIYKYDPVINMVKAQLGPGGTNLGIRYTISGRRDITQETRFDDTIGEYFKTLRSYDTNHNVTFHGFAYNATSTTNWTAYTWSNNLPTSAKDAEGALVEFEYTNGRLKTAKAYVASNVFLATRYDYTSNGLLASVTNANGHWQRFGYDAYGFMTSSVPQLGPSVRFEYNRLGSVTNIVMPWISGSRTTRIGVNELDWVTNVVYANGLGEVFRYDSLGNLTNQVDTAGRTNRLTWLPTGKPASATRWLDGASPTNVTIAFTYDNQFNTLRITDPMGRAVESYKLDLQDRPVAVTNLEGQAMVINWGVGNYVRSITRFDGSVVSNSYNADGLLAQVTGPSFTNSFTYYRNGALKTAANGNSTVANSFDLAGRLTAQQTTVGASTNTLAYQFNPVGNVTNVAVANTPVQAGWTYDAAERPLSLTAQAASNRVSFFQWNYNTNNGLVASVTNAAITESLGYDILDRATNIQWKTAGGTTVRGFGYAFNAAGMITNVSREDSGWTAYTYDSLDRLLSEKQYASTGLTYSASWNYDLAGNRTRAITNGVTNLYSYAAGNALTNFGAGTLMQYDLAGNVTNLQYSASKKLGLYWNGRYELTEVRSNGVSIEKYDYDALGRRVRIIAGTTTNTLVYDGPHVVAEHSNGTLIRTYTYGPGVDNLLSLTTHYPATNTYYCLKDHLGTVHALVNTNGVVVEQYRYTAWGETTVLSSNGAVLAASAYGNRFTWQGREISWQTGLLHFRSRYYAPTLGRWVSKDKIGIDGGHNLYQAFENSPVNFRDPFGALSLSGLAAASPLGVILSVGGFGIYIHHALNTGGLSDGAIGITVRGTPFTFYGDNYANLTPAAQQLIRDHEARHQVGFGEAAARRGTVYDAQQMLERGSYGDLLGAGGRPLTPLEIQEVSTILSQSGYWLARDQQSFYDKYVAPLLWYKGGPVPKGSESCP